MSGQRDGGLSTFFMILLLSTWKSQPLMKAYLLLSARETLDNAHSRPTIHGTNSNVQKNTLFTQAQ